MKRVGLTVLWIVACVLPVWGGDASVDEKQVREVRGVVKQLQARYEKTKDLQADFSQKTQIEGFERPVTSAGKVYIKKPGRLRWDYLDPSTEQIYVNHDDVKMYVPEHKQVLVGKLTQMAASKAPLELLQGAAKLDASFHIEPTTGNARGVGGIPLITLTPKDKQNEATQNLQKIVVEVFPKVYYIRTVSLYEVSGNVSVFVFSNLKPNVGLGNEIFDFSTPPDTEVVRAPVLNGP